MSRIVALSKSLHETKELNVVLSFHAMGGTVAVPLSEVPVTSFDVTWTKSTFSDSQRIVFLE